MKIIQNALGVDGDLTSVKSQKVRQRGIVSRFSCTTKAILSGATKIFFFETGQTIIGSLHNLNMPFQFYALQCSTNNTCSIDELMRSASTVNLPIV